MSAGSHGRQLSRACSRSPRPLAPTRRYLASVSRACSPEDRFYNPHDAKLVNGGDEILLIDDGNNRPGCTTTYERHCYSRAMHYRLNWDSMVAEVIWQVRIAGATEQGRRPDGVYPPAPASRRRHSSSLTSTSSLSALRRRWSRTETSSCTTVGRSRTSTVATGWLSRLPRRRAGTIARRLSSRSTKSAGCARR